MKINDIKEISVHNKNLNYPSGFYYEKKSDAFYIADMHNHRVCIMDRESGNIQELSGQTSNNKPLQRPLALAKCDTYGCIMVDAGNHDIYYQPKGEHVWVSIRECYRKKRNIEYEEAQLFNLPAGVAVDSEDNIYVNDFLNNRICEIDVGLNISVLIGGSNAGMADGSYDTARINRPFGLFYANRRLYFADEANDAIRFVDLDGAKVYTLAVYSMKERISKPIALTVDPEGNVIISEKRRLLYIDGKNGELRLIVDSNAWKALADSFRLRTRICHIGSLISPEKGCICWMDTISSSLYEIKVSF